MTALVGMHLGDYVLIAAHSRLTYYPYQRPTYFKDDKEKVKKVRSGLATGTGLGSLIDSVNQRLDEEDPLHTDRVIEIIREEREKVPAIWLQSDRVRNSLEYETSWMLSYVTSDNIDRPLDSFQLRVASCHPTHDYQLALYPATSGFLSLPPDLAPTIADELHNELVEGVRRLDDSQTLQDSINHRLLLAISVIHKVADVSESVSRNAQIGVHVASRQFGFLIGVSELWTPGQDFSLALRSIGEGNPG